MRVNTRLASVLVLELNSTIRARSSIVHMCVYYTVTVLQCKSNNININ